MMKSKKRLRFVAQNKAEAALMHTDEVLRSLMAKLTGAALREVTKSYGHVVDALSAIEAAYQDSAFSPKEVAIIRRLAAEGKSVVAIRRRVHRNINLLNDYMRKHGLHQRVRA